MSKLNQAANGCGGCGCVLMLLGLGLLINVEGWRWWRQQTGQE